MTIGGGVCPGGDERCVGCGHILNEHGLSYPYAPTPDTPVCVDGCECSGFILGPVLVGESNPYGADPFFALYPRPTNSAGGRMQRLVLGMKRRQYTWLDRYNLCEGPWRGREARTEAARLRGLRHGPFLLLGRKVATGFGMEKYEAFSVVEEHEGERHVRRTPAGLNIGHPDWRQFVLLPHPSGRNRQWQEPGAYARARRIVATVCPGLPLGIA